MCHVLAILNDFPHVKEALESELSSSDISISDTQRGSSYLQKVIDETMRLFPLNPLLSRVATSDTKIGDMQFKKGCEAIISCPGGYGFSMNH